MSARIPLILSAITLPALALALALGGPRASAQSQATIQLIGADAITAGNTAAAIGVRDSCVRAEVGQDVTVDIIVDEIPADRPMIGFQMWVRYDPALLQVVGANSDLMLGAVGQYQPFPGLSDPLPDTDGQYQIVIADLASRVADEEAGTPAANMESGKGTLSRLTFRAIAPGRSDVGPAFEGADIYPSIIDPQNTTIGVDSIAVAVVAIGQDCGSVPPAEQVTSLPPIEVVQGGTPPASGSGEEPSPTRTLAPGETPAPTDDSDVTDGSPTPTPDTASSPTTTATVLPGAGDDGTDTGMVAFAAVLALIGAAMAGAGGFVLYRRSQTAQGPVATE
jgi:hypothetical protein